MGIELEFMHEKFSEDRKNIMLIKDLSEKSGISISVLANIDCGRKKKVSHELVSQMCEPLGLNPDDYFRVKDKKAKVICVLNNKGGIGKSSCVSGLGYALAHKNKKILVLDSDLQGNLTSSLNMDMNEDKNFYEAYSKKEDIRKHIRPTQWENLWICTSSFNMSALEWKTSNEILKEFRLKQILQGIIEDRELDFDAILIDCSPSLNNISRSILFASDYLITPLVPTYFDLMGTQLTFEFLQEIQEHNHNIEFLGAIINKYDERKTITKDVMAIIDDLIGEEAILGYLPIDTNIEKSQLLSLPVGEVFPKSRATKAFDIIAERIIELCQI